MANAENNRNNEEMSFDIVENSPAPQVTEGNQNDNTEPSTAPAESGIPMTGTENGQPTGDSPDPSDVPTDNADTAGTLDTTEIVATPSPAPIDNQSQEEGGAAWLWIVFIVLFVLLAAATGVLLFFHLRKNGGKKPANKRPVNTNPHDGETEPIDDPFMESPETNPDAMGIKSNTEEITGPAVMQPRYSVGVAQTIGKRGNQEDSFACSNPAYADERGLLAVVADGVGGLNNGQVASSIIVRDMCSGFERQSPNRDMSSRLLELAAMAQSDVLRVNRQGERCGSTLVSVLIQNDAMVLLSIGDSRIALYRAGVLMPLNREHVLGKDIDENMALGYSDQPDNRKRTAITAYVGKENLKLIDRTITPMQVITGDRILLMSDGVFGTVGDDIIIDALSRYDVDTAARCIINAVDNRDLPHQDNATIVIVGIN